MDRRSLWAGVGLGFGCADLFRLPTSRERRRVLDAAFAAGITHFDVAPMYGLGRAEVEVGAFLRAHGDQITIATKFGIDVTPLGRVLGRVQSPVRQVLELRPGMRATVRATAAGPSSGGLGALIYHAPGFRPDVARSSVQASLRALGRDHVDLLLLHDPLAGSVADDLGGCLEGLVAAGSVAAWGVAGETADAVTVAQQLTPEPDVVQIRDDVFEPARVPDLLDARRITFGTLGKAIGRIAEHLRGDRDRCLRWSETVGCDVARPEAVAGLLLREARRRNPYGLTLFSSARPERIEAAVAAASSPDADDAVEAFVTLVESELGAPSTGERVR